MADDLARWNQDIQSGNPARVAQAAKALADHKAAPDTEYAFTIHDKWWQNNGEPAGDIMEASGTDPRNNVPSATLKLKGGSEHVPALMECRNTLVGLTVETGGQRFAYYLKTHDYEYAKGAWTSTANCAGIWDVLNYLQIWPMWYMPIQAQPISHAVFVGPIVTVIENMISECALRIQSGLLEFVNNALSLNPDLRAWFGTLLQSNGNIFQMLKTPIYVVRTNPFLDTSPLVAKTVRMESCATVIKELTGPYGVDVRVDLWLPGDAQPDRWASLDQPTYVVTVKDRSQITGPTHTVLDSVIRTVVDLGGSIGDIFNPIIQQAQGMQGVYVSPMLGVNFVQPYAIVVAPDEGDDEAIVSCKISDHTPEGWRWIIGGKSPKWLNDLINATMSWLIDSLMIIIGFTGVPSNILDGFMNDAFFAFQLWDHYTRRDQVGPYHPAMERFEATQSSPYNIEAFMAFLNAFYESRGYTSAIVTIRTGPNQQYALGRDIFRGGLMSLVYRGRTRMLTDYIENVMWRITRKERELTVQIGDGKADEPPLAKHQRFIQGLMEGFNVLTLAPNS